MLLTLSLKLEVIQHGNILSLHEDFQKQLNIFKTIESFSFILVPIFFGVGALHLPLKHTLSGTARSFHISATIE